MRIDSEYVDSDRDWAQMKRDWSEAVASMMSELQRLAGGAKANR